MAVKIPIYEDRLVPQGGVQAQARPVEVSDAIGRGMQRLGEAGTQLAGIEMRSLAEKMDADAVASVGSRLAEATGFYHQRVTDLSKGVDDNGFVTGNDGKPLLDAQGRGVSVVQQVRKEFDDWSKTFLGGIQSQKAQIYARTHVNSLWTSTYSRALAEEARIGVEVRDNQLDKSIASYAALAQTDDTTVEASLQAVKQAIANVGYDVAKRDAKALAAQKTIVEAAVQGAIQRNPDIARSAIEQRFRAALPANAVEASPLAPPAESRAAGDGVRDIVWRAEGGAAQNPQPGQSARGGGIIDSTWATYARRLNLGPELRGTREGFDRVWGAYQADARQTIGRDLTAGEQYLAWFLGPAGAKAFLEADRDADARQVYGQAAGERVAGEAFRVNGDLLRPGMTVGAVLDKVNAHYARFGGDPGAAGQQVSAAAPARPVPPALASLVDKLQADRVVPMLHAAISEEHRQSATFRTQVTQLIDDHQAQAMTGQPPQRPLTAADFNKAFGLEGPSRFEAYQQNLQVGQDIAAMQTMPPQDIADTLQRAQPVPDSPGFALQARRYAAMAEAANKISVARVADPIHAAIAARINDAKPLDFSTQEAFAESLRQRDGLALTMSETYGTPYRLLSKAEAETLTASLATMTSGQKLSYLDTIRRALTSPEAYRAVVQQVAADSPVTAVAGEILVAPGQSVGRRLFSSNVTYEPREVAARLLEGEALLNPTKAARGEDGRGKTFPMPLEKDMQQRFADEVGMAFAGDPNGAHIAYQAVKAWYAGESARTGDIKGALDSSRFGAAIEAVLGGKTSVNGRTDVLRPWGMSETMFLDLAKEKFDAAIAANNYKGTVLDNWGVYGLQAGGGRDKYLVTSGNGFLLGRDGNPVVIDMTRGVNNLPLVPVDGASPTPPPPSYEPPGAQRPERVEAPSARRQPTR